MGKLSCTVSDGARSVSLDAPDMLEINTSRVDHPWQVPPISHCFAVGIGKVALVWASYENEFDLFLTALIKATGYTSSTTWNLQKYSNRADILRETSAIQFATAPTILRYIECMLGRAGNLQSPRNILAHGRLKNELTVVGETLDAMHIKTTLFATDQRRCETRAFTPESIEEIYYRLAHLSGVMHRLANRENPPERISSPDKQILRDFLRDHHPTYANGQTPSPPLGSSEG